MYMANCLPCVRFGKAPDHESVLPDLLRQDPRFSGLDLVICRNVLIYMQRPLQERVFQTFRYALRPGGFLFLGSAETTDETGVVFKVLDKRHRLYRRQKCGRRMGD